MKRPEEALHRTVAAYLRAVEPECLWWATANQRGTRSRFEMGILKALGVRAGVPDLCFILDGGTFAAIELKADKGRQSDAQRAFEVAAVRLGARYLVCRSLAEVEGALDAWGVRRKGRVAA